jgi:hypothetical protein
VSVCDNSTGWPGKFFLGRESKLKDLRSTYFLQAPRDREFKALGDARRFVLMIDYLLVVGSKLWTKGRPEVLLGWVCRLDVRSVLRLRSRCVVRSRDDTSITISREGLYSEFLGRHA